MTQLVALLSAAIVFGTVIMLGAIGETITEKAGILNLGAPGIMYIGGISSLAAAFFYETHAENPSRLLCLLLTFGAAFFGSALAGLLFGFLTITLRGNQNVTGLTLTIFGGGVANFFGGSLNKLAGGVGQISVPVSSSVYRATLPFSMKLGSLGEILLNHGFLVYLAIVLAVLVQYFLSRSRKGLNLRAVGENPATADSAGISVERYRYLAVCIGSGITGLGGLFYVMDYTKGTWGNDGSIEGLGWLAVALVIFTTWKTVNAIWGAYLFGVLYWMFFYLEGLTRSSQELFKMLPYLVTILVLIFTSLRKKKESQPPAGLGLPYFREDR
jgi:simple sugar transport system permease protein